MGAALAGPVSVCWLTFKRETGDGAGTCMQLKHSLLSLAKGLECFRKPKALYLMCFKHATRKTVRRAAMKASSESIYASSGTLGWKGTCILRDSLGPLLLRSTVQTFTAWSSPQVTSMQGSRGHHVTAVTSLWWPSNWSGGLCGSSTCTKLEDQHHLGMNGQGFEIGCSRQSGS